jgi:glycosyltransferase involved in cell wall biosynthesis
MPLVSIITPVYNAERFIEKSILSVLNQTYEDWEMLVIDDCSTDNSLAVVKKYSLVDSRIRLINMPKNSGVAAARNTGVNVAKGRFIAFLDSDDTWMPSKLSDQVRYMLDNKYYFTYTSYQVIDDKDRIINNRRIETKLGYRDLLKTCSIGCLTVMYDTSYFGKRLMPLRRREDLGLWLDLLKEVDYAFGIDEVLAQYRVSSNSMSTKKVLAAKHQWKLYREYQDLGFFKSIYYFIHYAINGYIKHKIPY